MKKVIDILLILGLLVVIGFFVYIERGRENEIQSPPATAIIAASTPTFIGSTALAPSSFSPTAPTAASFLARTSTLTPTSTVTAKPRATPTSVPAKTATPTGIPTQASVENEIRAGTEQGNRIVQAIESYSQAQGFYPPTLSDLVPVYLPALPVTETGQPFFYRVFDRTTPMSSEIYWVAFKVTGRDHVTCTYFRRLQYWDCNFDSP